MDRVLRPGDLGYLTATSRLWSEASCQRGMSVGFTTDAGLVHELMEVRDERRLLNLQRQLVRLNLLIIDELGFVPLSRTGAELLFEVFRQRYQRGSTMVTTNLPFDEWTEVFGSERLTGALLDRLTHHVHILEMNGECYRLKRSRETAAPPHRRHQTNRTTLSSHLHCPLSLPNGPHSTCHTALGHHAGGTRLLRRSGTFCERP